MKEVAISEFKAKCLALLEQVRQTKKPIRVTRFGKPVAEIVPPSPDAGQKSWIGSMKDTRVIDRGWLVFRQFRGSRAFPVWRRVRSRDPDVAHKRRLETVVTTQAWRSEERQDLQQATMTFVTLWQPDRRFKL